MTAARSFKELLLTATMGALLAGCQHPPRSAPGELPESSAARALSTEVRAELPQVPAQWVNLSTATPGGSPIADVIPVPSTPAGDLLPAAWWRLYGDPRLSELVESALATSPTAKIAKSRVQQARALAELADAKTGPRAGWSTSAGRARAAGDAKAETKLDLALSLNWDLDLGGQAAAASAAARLGQQAATAQADAARLALAADTAMAWLQLLAMNERLRLQAESIRNAQAVLNLLQVQREAGRASGLDLARQRAQLAEEQAAVAPLDLQRKRWHSTLAALLGRSVYEVPVPHPSAGLDDLTLPPVQPGLPADLLLRRPAVRHAEWRLAQADANVMAARAAVLPKLGLDARVGLSARDLAGLAQPAAWLHGLALQLAGTLFDGNGSGDGAARAGIQFAQAEREERVQAYVQALVDGWREVEDALASLEESQRQAEWLALAVTASQQAADLAEARLRLGSADAGLVLEARRQLLAQQHALLQARQARTIDTVTLYRAVAGPWRPADKDASLCREVSATPSGCAGPASFLGSTGF
jgi:NodT family efflux transporter outer membrane factor (OMF) lipoprotein